MSAFVTAWERLEALELGPREARTGDALTAVCPLNDGHGRTLRIATDADPRFGGLIVSTSCGCRALDVRAAIGVPAEPHEPLTLDQLAARAIEQGRQVAAGAVDAGDALDVLMHDALAAGIADADAQATIAAGMRSGARGAA